MMIERGLHHRRHAPDQARLATLRRACHPVRHLHCSHRLCRRNAIATPTSSTNSTWRDWSTIRSKPCVRDCLRNSSLFNLDVLPLYIALMGCFSAGAVDDAAPARPDHAGLDRTLARGPAVRLEPTGLPRRHLVLNPYCWQCCSYSARGAHLAGP